MQTTRRIAALVATLGLALAACSGGATTAPTTAPESMAPESTAPESAAPTVDPESLLGRVMAADKIVMSTDPQYPPQSSLKSDGTFEGFDIDVGTEIATRLGFPIEFATPDWNLITAGSWGGRWDFSVGSMSITTPREKVLAFSDPYYFTPAQMATSVESGITTLDGLDGKVICVGEATTYYDWLQGTLDLGSYTPTNTPPAGSTATTLTTDRLCAETWKAGRTDFQGWLSSETTVDQAVADGLPLVKVGDPVFYEPLGVAFDKSGPDPTGLIELVNQVLADMRADGTLQGLSVKWFGDDLTVGPDTN